MITLNAVFITYNGGFCCSNDGDIHLTADTSSDITGNKNAVRKQRILQAKKPFTHGKKPIVGMLVKCLTRMTIGNVYDYDGIITHVMDSGNVLVNLTSVAKTDSIKQLIADIPKM